MMNAAIATELRCTDPILRCSEEPIPYIFMFSPTISVQRTPAAPADLMPCVGLLMHYRLQKQRQHAADGLDHSSYVSVVSGVKDPLFRVHSPNLLVVFP